MPRIEELIRFLGDGESPLEASLFGSKAHNLDVMRHLGLGVPDAVCLSARLFTDAAELNCADALIPILCRLFFDEDNSYLAVRSSSKQEDSAHESQAGRYLTVITSFQTPADVMDAVIRVSRSGEGSIEHIPVVIQRAVPSRHSGVAFSCNPVTFERSRPVLSFIAGMGADLVSGKADGRTLTIDPQNGNWEVAGAPQGETIPIESQNLSAIRDGLSLLQEEYGCPVDTEWAIDQDGRLFWIQVRPVVLPQSKDLPLSSAEAFALLPAIVRDHHKLRLRKWAIQAGIAMPGAVAHVRSSDLHPPPAVTSVATESAGTSIVLLYPTLVDGQVQREFSGTSGSYADMIIESCQRYSIRRYPKFLDVPSAISNVIARGLDRFWTSIAIDAKVLDAQLTGTISRIDDGYLVELAQGHFVPKGVVATQQFVLSEQLELLHFRPAEQDFALRFVDGRVVHEHPIADPAVISERHAIAACKVLGPALTAGDYQAFEFGILDGADTASLYLIDTVESEGPTGLTSKAIEAGIISPGFAHGRLHVVDDTKDGDVLDHHLHSVLDAGYMTDTIFIAERDSIDLLPLVGSLGENCALLFRSASVLSHLSIVLREKNIPAAVIGPGMNFSLGSEVTVDTAEIERLYAASREEP
jgi:hypothetical protein